LVDVNEIIRGMIELLRSEATRYSISMRTELSEDLPQIMGDRVQLQQVTMNLVINSIDAMKDVDGTREIAITSERAENEQRQVSVSDTGIGLPHSVSLRRRLELLACKLHFSLRQTGVSYWGLRQVSSDESHVACARWVSRAGTWYVCQPSGVPDFAI
jgi:light-regulated signal transduction histidine kinase (bacteriophytochrome)